MCLSWIVNIGKCKVTFGHTEMGFEMRQKTWQVLLSVMCDEKMTQEKVIFKVFVPLLFIFSRSIRCTGHVMLSDLSSKNSSNVQTTCTHPCSKYPLAPGLNKTCISSSLSCSTDVLSLPSYLSLLLQKYTVIYTISSVHAALLIHYSYSV